MSERWVEVGRPEDLRFTPGAPVRVEDRWIAIFPVEDGSGYVAIDNACPHAGAPLCDGTVSRGKVVCFLHLWEFDLQSGACDQGEAWNVRVYPVRVQDGVLQIAV